MLYVLDHELERNVDEHRVQKAAFQAVETMLAGGILSYFENDRNVDVAHLLALRRSVVFRRLEDETKRIGLPTLLVRQDRDWNILIHGRLIDSLALLLADRPELSLSEVSGEERKILKFCEFFLRHHFEQLLFPDASELEAIGSDSDFALGLEQREPKGYADLLEMLDDPQWGAFGKSYATLLRRAKLGERRGFGAGRVAVAYAGQLAELPTGLLINLFPDLDKAMKSRVLDKMYKKGSVAGLPAAKKSAELMKILRLFGTAVVHNPDEALELFTAFDKRRGVGPLLGQLDISTPLDRGKPLAELFEIFKTNLEELVQQGETFKRGEPREIEHPGAPGRLLLQSRSLKERIDEARTDPDVPHSVIEVIEKNKMNATGQSGAKYTELIETLLTIPWGRIKKIWITPEEFDEGLNQSHYGLKQPKEIISDLFANLIWRYQHFKEAERRSWHRTGSALLFVGPTGVGKTSLAISIARNLGIPYHKISLGGMKDEADIRGYGFTYPKFNILISRNGRLALAALENASNFRRSIAKNLNVVPCFCKCY